MSETNAPPTTPKPDASIDDIGRHFFGEDAGGGADAAPTQAHDVPQGSQDQNPSAPAGTPQPPASSPYKVRLKEDDVETDIDLDEYVKDPTKSAELRKWLQTGRQHEKLVERRTKKTEEDTRAQTAQFFLEQLRENGIEFGYDPTKQKYVAVRRDPGPQTSGAPYAQTSGVPSAPAPADEVTTLLAEVERLEKVAETEETAASVVALVRAQRKLADAQARAYATRETSGIKAWQQQTEAQRQTEHLTRLRETALAAAKDVFQKHAAVFDGFNEAERAGIIQSAAQTASTVEELRAKLEAFAARETERVQAQIRRMAGNGATAARQPVAAPPIHNGAPPAAGGASTATKDFSTLDRDWAKNLIPD